MYIHLFIIHQFICYLIHLFVNDRFQAFESCYRDIITLFEAWDRTTGSVFLSESEKSELEQDTVPLPVTKKGQTSHKKMEKEKEKTKEV